MPISPQVIDAMVASGCTAEQLAAVVKASIREEMEKTLERRTYERERKQKQRARPRDITGQTGTTPPPKERSPTPSKEITPSPPHSETKVSSFGSRLPDDWAPLREENIPDEIARRECAKFRDYWHSKAGAMARKVDWQATWRNWCRKAMEDQQNRRQQKMNYVDTAIEMVARGELCNEPDETSPWGNRTNVELLPDRRTQRPAIPQDIRNGTVGRFGERNH